MKVNIQDFTLDVKAMEIRLPMASVILLASRKQFVMIIILVEQ